MVTLFGIAPDGRPTHLFSLRNSRGFGVDISNYGGTVVRLFAPDRQGDLADVVLGFNRLEDYVARSPYFGCIIGRFGNRIAHGRFTLDGVTRELACNNSPGDIPCSLHGGRKGFDKAIWRPDLSPHPDTPTLRLAHRSPDGDEGFPGDLDVTVTYALTADDALRIDYEATASLPTPVNLTNHSYFNLAGEGSGDVLDHIVTFRASHFTPVNVGLIPLGHLAPVAGTPFDFTSPHTIGQRIDAPHDQLRFGLGYDHNFVIDRGDTPPSEPVLAATVHEPKSGRTLEVLTSEPGMQFYTGNILSLTRPAKNNHVYRPRHGFCLETQHFPDSPNQPAFPSTILRPGVTLRSTTIYRFSTA